MLPGLGIDASMLQTDLIKAQIAESRDLLIALHGLGDSMEGYRWVPRMLEMPEVNVVLVNAPDAYYGGFSWYDFANDPAPGVERSYRLLESLLDGLVEKGFPTERTVLFGFSQGCLMSFETGLRYRRKFAGLVGVSGYVHEPERLLKLVSPFAREQRFLITHGTRDALIPARMVRPQIEMLKGAGVQIEYREFDKDHTMLEEEIRAIRDWVGERFKQAR
jgi:phospholipase/carboxylesterase